MDHELKCTMLSYKTFPENLQYLGVSRVLKLDTKSTAYERKN